MRVNVVACGPTHGTCALATARFGGLPPEVIEA